MGIRQAAIRYSFGRIVYSETGETLVETLISILVCAIAILMMSTAIGSSVNVVQSTRKHMEDYYKNESEMIAGSGTDMIFEFNIALKLEENTHNTKKKISIALHEMDGTDIAYYEVN